MINSIATYALRLGDDALVLSHRLAQWSTWAPDLEEDIALTNIALLTYSARRAHCCPTPAKPRHGTRRG